MLSKNDYPDPAQTHISNVVSATELTGAALTPKDDTDDVYDRLK